MIAWRGWRWVARLRRWRFMAALRWSCWWRGEDLRTMLIRGFEEALAKSLTAEARLRVNLVNCSCAQGVAGGIAIAGGPSFNRVVALCALHGEVEGVTPEQALAGVHPRRVREGSSDGSAGGFLVPDAFLDDLAILHGTGEGAPQGIIRRPATKIEEA